MRHKVSPSMSTVCDKSRAFVWLQRCLRLGHDLSSVVALVDFSWVRSLKHTCRALRHGFAASEQLVAKRVIVWHLPR